MPKRHTKRFAPPVCGPADKITDMEPDAIKLYELIWRQFVACQMTPAQYDSSTLTVAAANFELKAKGRILRFAGWTKALPPMGRKGVTILSCLRWSRGAYRSAAGTGSETAFH